ncbi:rho GTPase-activating protein 27 isoform X2 [Periophthalmus magnuspinnatus]|uniref:rho GTPase-activating protein 27 isoform X2 n=1 Tax=Periophthalmus magnuspinnatus TaxID=409849 RepID=UPI002436CC27|nr:rho GTPase-activating protein 27 isoform X2 [Periophthalmus magnuspinnatus]
METAPVLSTPGLGLVLVEFEYQYRGRDGDLIQIRPNERYELLTKTNAHWWQVRTKPGSKPFYIPAKYVRELPHVPDLSPALCLPIGQESTSPAPMHTSTAPVPVPVPVLPKTPDEPRKPSDQVTIRLRSDGAYRRTENRMSTFGFPLDSDVSTAMPRTTNGTTNMADSLRVPTSGDSGNSHAHFTRHQPIPVEMPRPPPTHAVTQETATQSGRLEAQEGHLSQTGAGDEESEELPEEPSESEEEREEEQPLKEKEVREEREAEHPKEHPKEHPEEQPEENTVENQEERPSHREQRGEGEEREGSSSHIYESIQDLNIDLDALIGRDTMPKQEVESEAPSPAQESKPDSPIYANVYKNTIPPPPSDPAPPAPGPAPSLSGSSCSGLSPASPLSPLDEWQAHTDTDSGKLFYFNALTRRTTWTPPSEPSPTHSQWERLVDEVSGRFYFFNPTTGATSWDLPESHTPLSSRTPNTHPPLPEEDYPHNQAPDDSVFTTNLQLQIPRAQLDPKVDLRQSERTLGNGVPDSATSHTWRHSVAEDRFSSLRRHASDVTERSKGHIPDATQGHMLEKAGIINKTKVCENGKKLRKNWSQSWTVLHGGILTFHRDPKSAPAGTNSKASQIVPEFTVDLRGASVSWAHNKSSKKNVLELKTRQGCEFLIQYDTESIVSDWYKVISEAIQQLSVCVPDWDGPSEDSDDSDQERTKRNSSRSDPEQRRVRHKLRRFLQRRPTLQSVKEKGYIRDAVFGCHLDTLCHRENSTVPRFVQKCVRFVERRGLDTDGIYRVSGNLAVIQKLRHKADHEEQLDLEDGDITEVHVVTGALKLFFRELPEPLFPFSSYDKFIAAIQLPQYSQRVSYIKDLVQILPLPNHSTMELLFRHLHRVVEHGEQNRMSCQSLAIVFGPTLLRPQVESNLTVHMVFQSQIIELLLREGPDIFTPPQ